MRILFAIISCWLCELNGDNKSLRDTWINDIPRNMDYKFFHGTGYSCFPGSDRKVCKDDVPNPPADIVTLETPEAYQYLIPRAKELYTWAYNHGYDYVWKGYPDTYVDVERLLSSQFAKFDYYGHWLTAPGTPRGDGTVNQFGCLGGGEGFWLSRKACEIVSKMEWVPVNSIGEDTWVGEVMGRHGIAMVDDPAYGEGTTLHGSVRHRPIDYRPGTYDNRWLYETYKRLKG